MINEKDRLVKKSVEAFIMGLEIYNKPTIQYRIEGFSFFICNAWELMLKAEMINRGKNIYYKDNPNRTYSLERVLKEIYSDKNTRTRINLEKIIELRNISTHYITEDYEIKYAPLFQSCVLNFVKEILRFHAIDMTQHIAQNFLTIAASYDPLSNEQIMLKYPPEVAEKFIKQGNEIDVLCNEYKSDNFSIDIRQNLYITKKKTDADFTVCIDRTSDAKVAMLKELKDPSDTHKLSFGNVIDIVNSRLDDEDIVLNENSRFNSHILTLFIRFYDVKRDLAYSYEHKIGKRSTFSYSYKLIEFILAEIKKNPTGFVASLKR